MSEPCTERHTIDGLVNHQRQQNGTLGGIREELGGMRANITDIRCDVAEIKVTVNATQIRDAAQEGGLGLVKWLISLAVPAATGSVVGVVIMLIVG